MVKVLIGISAFGKHRYCLDEFLSAVKSLKAERFFVADSQGYASFLHSIGESAVFSENPKNHIRLHSIKNNFDFVLFLDSNIIPPANALDALLSVNSDIAVGVYLSEFTIDSKQVIAPVLFRDLGDGNCQLYTYDGAAVSRVFDVGSAGLGCVLLSKKALELVFGSSETGFFVSARENGFRISANTFVKCIHRAFPADDKRAALFEWRRKVEDWTYTARLPE